MARCGSAFGAWSAPRAAKSARSRRAPVTPETLGQHREQELRDAMAILGVDVRFLDFAIPGMRGTPENAGRAT
jgi:LmbE family N-acetylglucosaminyl deacetylase